jgi:DnaJ-class molecular chaperone
MYYTRREYEKRKKENAKKQHTDYRSEYNDSIKPEFKQFYSLDPFTVLGVSRSDSMKTITKHYRKLMFKYHPDRNANEYTQIAQFINSAYDDVKKIKK